MLYIQEVWAANGMVFYTGFVMGTEGVYVDLGTGKCEVFENSLKQYMMFAISTMVQLRSIPI